MKTKKNRLTVPGIGLAALLCGGTLLAQEHQATGVKIGDVDQDSAILWMRYTLEDVISPDHLAPGTGGYVRVRYDTNATLSASVDSGWVEVNSSTDYTRQFALTNLSAGQTYYYSADTRTLGLVTNVPMTGSFHTAYASNVFADVTFTAITGMRIERMRRSTDEADGYTIYPSMGELNPDFMVPTGDTVYYDYINPPFSTNTDPALRGATNLTLARQYWNTIYALPRLIEFHRTVPGYWQVDDHDSLRDDCWAGSNPLGDLTFAQGYATFKEQTPISDLTYRTTRWGRDMQVWVTEGRLYRTHGSGGGSGASIWGNTQKQWFKETVDASDATWKVLVNATPLVGPDRKNMDNHVASGFQDEGDELRAFMTANHADDLILVVGDRHWQYHSIHPGTKLHEFCVGPANNNHAVGAVDEDLLYHAYYGGNRVGGFGSVNVTGSTHISTVTVRHHGEDGSVLNAWRKDMLRPGDQAIDTMSVSTFINDTALKMQIGNPGTNDQVQISGDLVLGNPNETIAANRHETFLRIEVLDGATPTGRYTIITYTGTKTGDFQAVYGLVDGWSLDFSVPHQVDLVTDDSPPVILEFTPFTETFENTGTNAGTLGNLDGQNGWVVSSAGGSATVQSNIAFAGTQAAALEGAVTVQHAFIGTPSNIRVSFATRLPDAGDAPPDVPADAAAAFYVGSNQNLMAYNGTTAVEQTFAVTPDTWYKFDIYCDYAAQTWDLRANGTNVLQDFAFYSTRPAFDNLLFRNFNTSNTLYLDTIDLTDETGAPDADGDGLPDWWETQYYGGPTNANPKAMASNGINTVLEAYIAGLNPTNPASLFVITGLESGQQNVVYWPGVSGRVYTVYWSSNFSVSGFDLLENNIPWTDNVFTDTNHSADEKGFYKIKVDLE